MGRARFLVAAALAAPLVTLAADAPRWPLDVTPVLTSSFGEFRANHLHAGIDLGTGGRVGLACRAVGDGSIVRLRMSPFGYGKALYLKLDSGPLVVYAHLSRFASPMAERARSEQERRQRYTFDIELPAGSMRVLRGAVIGWSGQSGVGYPHLHFEMRDGDVARNPQTAGFAVPDTIPPSVAEFVAMPMDPESHVAGGLEPVPLPANVAAAPLVLSGRIGFGVRAWDHATSRQYRQGPYRYELRVDGEVLYRMTSERFDYAHNHQVVLEYDQERFVDSGDRVQLLYVRPGNRLPGRHGAAPAGGLFVTTREGHASAGRFGPGEHALDLEVADAAGNVTRRQARVVVSDLPEIRELAGTWREDRLRWRCRATDPAGPQSLESLHGVFELSRDQGATWEALVPDLVRVEPDGGRTWAGEAPWDGQSRVALRAQVRDRLGLTAQRSWTGGDRPETDARLPLAVRVGWSALGSRVDIESPVPLAGAGPVLVARGPDGALRGFAPAVRQIGSSRYRAVGLPASLDTLEVRATGMDGRRAVERLPVRMRRALRGERVRIDDLDPDLVVEIPAGALVDDLALRAERRPASALELGSELRAAGPCVAVEPRAAAFDEPVTVMLRPSGDDSGVGLFWVTRGGETSLLSTERGADGAYVGRTRFLSTFALLRDTTPPWLGPVRRTGGGKRALRIRFTVRDDGAGIDDGGIVVEIDGAPAIPEWDPETGVVVVEPSFTLRAGAHPLRIAVTDAVGNRNEHTQTLHIE